MTARSSRLPGRARALERCAKSIFLNDFSRKIRKFLKTIQKKFAIACLQRIDDLHAEARQLQDSFESPGLHKGGNGRGGGALTPTPSVG